MSSAPVPRLEIADVSKTFGTTKVLERAALTIRPGEVHGLIGQNGSGKSTLIKVLTGYHASDAGGTLAVDGKAVRLPVRWRDAHDAGVSVVHQDLGLLDQLTVAENICVGGYLRSPILRRIDWKNQNRVAVRTLARLQVAIEPTALVSTLTSPQRAEVAIARAIRDQVPGTGLIILDESTRALGQDDRRRFHQMLRRIVDEGTSALIVSHDLEEILQVTDRVTILRDGRLAGAGLVTAELTEAEMARRMLGKDIEAMTAKQVQPPAPATEPFVVSDLSGGPVSGVGLRVSPGEVVGLTGLPGNGFEEIPYLLAGVRPASGRVTRGTTAVLDLAKASTRSATQAGIVLVPERRDRDGLAFDLSVQDNISLPTLSKRGRPWFVSRRWQQLATEEAISTLGITPNAPSRLVSQLSGGNQQKVLLGKWLSVGPQLLILHEPTQAVDVGARQDLLRAIQRAARSGVAVLLVSVEPSDLVLGVQPGSRLPPARRA